MTHEAKHSAPQDVGWDERAVAPLIKTLEARDPDMRRSAALALGHIRDGRVVGPLVAALRDPDPEVRRWAVLGLGRIGDLSALPAMIACLRETGESERAAAQQALAMIGAPAIPALAQTLRHYNPDTGCAAASVLGRIADPEAVGPLLGALQAPEVRMRMAAARALADSAAVNPTPQVRAALAPLRRLAWQEHAAFYRGIIARIEGATAPTAFLPIPAGRPDPPTALLPIPTGPPTPDPHGLPIPAASGADGQTDSETFPEALGWRRRLSRLLARAFPPRRPGGGGRR